MSKMTRVFTEEQERIKGLLEGTKTGLEPMNVIGSVVQETTSLIADTVVRNLVDEGLPELDSIIIVPVYNNGVFGRQVKTLMVFNTNKNIGSAERSLKPRSNKTFDNGSLMIGYNMGLGSTNSFPEQLPSFKRVMKTLTGENNIRLSVPPKDAQLQHGIYVYEVDFLFIMEKFLGVTPESKYNFTVIDAMDIGDGNHKITAIKYVDIHKTTTSRSNVDYSLLASSLQYNGSKRFN